MVSIPAWTPCSISRSITSFAKCSRRTLNCVACPKLLAHDFLYSNANHLVTFFDLHDVTRFLNEPGATFDGLQRAFTFLLTTRGIPIDLLWR